LIGDLELLAFAVSTAGSNGRRVRQAGVDEHGAERLRRETCEVRAPMTKAVATTTVPW